MLLGCKLASFVQSVCNMASDELCLREGKVFANEVGVGVQAVERDRLKADFVKMLRKHPKGLPVVLFKDAYEKFFHRPLVLVRAVLWCHLFNRPSYGAHFAGELSRK